MESRVSATVLVPPERRPAFRTAKEARAYNVGMVRKYITDVSGHSPSKR